MSKIGRRQLIRTGLAAGAMVAAASCSPKKEASTVRAPGVITNSLKDVTLRFIGTGAAQSKEMKAQAEKDLGFKIQLRALGTEENNQIAIPGPKQYDIFDGEYFSLPRSVSIRKSATARSEENQKLGQNRTLLYNG